MSGVEMKAMRRRDSPLLQVALSDPPEAKGADGKDGAEDDGSSGSLGREVAAVGDGSEALGWGEVSAVGGFSCCLCVGRSVRTA